MFQHGDAIFKESQIQKSASINSGTSQTDVLVLENCALLGYYVVSSGNYLPMLPRVKNPRLEWLPGMSAGGG
jgi:hypothetical protein